MHTRLSDSDRTVQMFEDSTTPSKWFFLQAQRLFEQRLEMFRKSSFEARTARLRIFDGDSRACQSRAMIITQKGGAALNLFSSSFRRRSDLVLRRFFRGHIRRWPRKWDLESGVKGRRGAVSRDRAPCDSARLSNATRIRSKNCRTREASNHRTWFSRTR